MFKRDRILRSIFALLCVFAFILALTACQDKGAENNGEQSGNTTEDHVHSYGVWTTEEAPSCLNEGVALRLCVICGAQDRKILPALGHDFIEDTCSRCGYKLTETPGIAYLPTENNQSLYIKGYEDSATDVVFPSKHSGATVLGVSDGFNASSLRRISFINGSNLMYLSYSFNDCENLVSVTLSDNIYQIDHCFTGCEKLEEINVPAGNGEYSSIDGVLFNKTGTVLLKYPSGKKDTHYVVPSSVTAIAPGAFEGCKNLRSLTLPENNELITAGAFDGCTFSYVSMPASAIENVSYEEVTEVVVSCGEAIPEEAFVSYAKLAKVTLKEGIEEIGKKAFYGCGALTEIVLPASLTLVGEDAFDTQANLPDAVFTKYSGRSSASVLCSEKTILLSDKFGREILSCDCNVFSSNLSTVKTSGSHASVSDVVLSSFDEIGASYKVLTGDFNLPERYTVFTPTSGSVFFSDYTSFTDRIKSTFLLSSYDVSASVRAEDSVLVGLNKSYACALESDLSRDYYDYVTVVSRLFGCDEASSFIARMSAFISVYGNNSSDSALLYDGAVITADGDVLFPYLFKNSEAVVLAVAILDSNNVLSFWLSDYEKALGMVSSYEERDYFPSWINKLGDLSSLSALPEIEIVGRCELFETPALGVFYAGDVTSWMRIDFTTALSNPLYYAPNLYAENDLIKELVVPSGVTGISSYAFVGCNSLTEVVLPDTLTEIGQSAFSHCQSLLKVTLGSSLTTVGTESFYDCPRLIEVVNKSSLTLETGSSGNGYVAANARLAGAESTATWETTDDGYVIYTENTNKILIAYLGCDLFPVLPEGITAIADTAFLTNHNVISITLPATLKSIASGTFESCLRLIEVYNKSRLSIVRGSGDFGSVAFYAEDVYTSAYESKLVKSGDFVYYNTETSSTLVAYLGKSRSIVVPDTVTAIRSYAFAEKHVTDVVIPDTVTVIGDNAFTGCELSKVSFPSILCSSVVNPSKETLTEVTVSSGSTLPKNAFFNCKKLEKIVLPASVSVIGDNAFYNCESLTTVSLPVGLSSLGDYAFFNCRSLTEVTLPQNMVSFSYGLFSGCKNLTAVTLSDETVEIGWAMFENCSSLTSFTLPAHLRVIQSRAFSGCENLTSLPLPETVYSIGTYAFSGCKNLTSIALPASVTEVKAYAFYSCLKLGSVSLPSSITAIGDYAFYNCAALEMNTLPFNVKSIGSYAFYMCSRLTTFTVPASVKTIGDNAFMSCQTLATLNLSEGLTTIGKSAFENCRLLTSISVPSTVTEVGEYAFRSCPINVASLPAVALRAVDKSALYSVSIIKGDVTENALKNCESLREVRIGNQVTSIAAGAFAGCANITSFLFEGSSAQWAAIEKAAGWDTGSTFTVTFTD